MALANRYCGRTYEHTYALVRYVWKCRVSDQQSVKRNTYKYPEHIKQGPCSDLLPCLARCFVERMCHVYSGKRKYQIGNGSCQIGQFVQTGFLLSLVGQNHFTIKAPKFPVRYVSFLPTNNSITLCLPCKQPECCL